MPAEIEAELIQVLELPGAAVYPESIGIDPATGDAYVGSLADGALYRLAGAEIRDGQAETWSGAGPAGAHQSPASRSTVTGGCGRPAATTARCGSMTCPAARC